MPTDHISQFITMLPALLTSLAALITALSGIIIYMVNNLHKAVNSRLDQLVVASIAQGRQDERDSHSVTVPGVPSEPK